MLTGKPNKEEEKTTGQQRSAQDTAAECAQTYTSILHASAGSLISADPDATQLICAIASNMGFIRQTESYIPVEEFKSLLKCMESSLDLQSTCFTQLIVISDLIMTRKKWASGSPEMIAHLKTLQDSLSAMPHRPFAPTPYNKHIFNNLPIYDVVVPKKISVTLNYLFDAFSPLELKSNVPLIEGYFARAHILKYNNDEQISRFLDGYKYQYGNTILNMLALESEKKYPLMLKIFEHRYGRGYLLPIFELLKNQCNDHSETIKLFEMLLLALKNAEQDEKGSLHLFGQDIIRTLTENFYFIIESAKTVLTFDELKSIMKKIDFQVKIFNEDFIKQNYFFLPMFISYLKDEITATDLINSDFFKQITLFKAEHYFYLLLEIMGEKAIHEMNLSPTTSNQPPISLPPLLVNGISENTNFLAFIAKIYQEVKNQTPLIFFTQYQYEIKQLFQFELSEFLFLKGIKSLDIENVLDGLSILRLNKTTIDILSEHFKHKPHLKQDFIENIYTLSAVAERMLLFPPKYKRNAFKNPKPSENEIDAFLASLKSTATNWEKIAFILPLSILNLTATDLTLIEPLSKLLEKLEKANKAMEQAGFIGVDIVDFLDAKHESMYAFIKLTGQPGADYIQKQIVGLSILPLERTLTTLTPLSEKWISAFTEYFKKYSNKNNIHILKNCITALGILKVTRSSVDNDDLEYYLQLAHNKHPNEFQLILLKNILKNIFPDRNDELERLYLTGMDALLKNISIEELSDLCLAAMKIKDTQYNPFFLSLLWNDLMGIPNSYYLHDTQQSNTNGKKVADHNSKIQEKLAQHHINPNDALESYQNTRKSVDLIIWPTEMTDTAKARVNQLVALWNYLLKVEESLIQDEKSTEKTNIAELVTIKKNIRELKTKIQKNQQNEMDTSTIATVLSSNSSIDLIDKITRTFTGLKTKKINTNNSQFEEFSQHVVNHLNTFPLKKSEEETKSNKDEKTKKEKTHPTYIRIQQWDKSNRRTFFLGDDVSCCLATTGAQFQAMVQRRLDDALFFFVATDQSLNEPVALIWCYLAETKQGDIVLMANFFEVRVSRGVDDHQRLSILYGLLEFAKQYLQDNPNIKGFYLNQLTYGLNIKDLTDYPSKMLVLSDKVGGPLIPSEDASYFYSDPSNLTTELYYLNSLSELSFHVFDPAILSRNRPPAIATINELVRSFIQNTQNESKEWINTEAALKKLIIAHEAELVPFYEKPLSQNAQLKLLVSEELEFNFVQNILREKNYPEDKIQDTYGITACHLAINCGDSETLTALLQNENLNIDINKKSHPGLTPLDLAVKLNLPDLAQLLLDSKKHNIDPNTPDALGKTPLVNAVMAGHTAVIKELLKNTKIKSVVFSESINIVADKTERISLRRTLNNKGLPAKGAISLDLTPLHAAICLGNIEAVKLMIIADFDIQATTKNNMSCLEYAQVLNRWDMIDVFTAINKFDELNIQSELVRKTAIKSVCESSDPIKTAYEIIRNLHKLKYLQNYGINTEINQLEIVKAGNRASQIGYGLWKSKVKQIILQRHKNKRIYPQIRDHAASALRYGMFSAKRDQEELENKWNTIFYEPTADKKEEEAPSQSVTTPIKTANGK